MDRLAEDVELLGSRGLPREEYFAEVTARLRKVIPSVAACWHTLDPQTRLMTSDAPHELVSSGVLTAETVMAAGALLVASEYFVPDVNTFAGLARRRATVATLSHATGGHPERSARYRDLLAPSGIPHELRAAFVSRGRCWGAVHIARSDDQPDFIAEEVAALGRITTLVAEGIRTSLRFDAGRRPETGTAPGLVVLGPRNEVELITPPAHELMAAMRSGAQSDSDQTPPSPLLALAAFTRSGPAEPDASPRTVAVPTSLGWITLHAALPDGTAAGRVAVVLERAPSRAVDGRTARGARRDRPRARDCRAARPRADQPRDRRDCSWSPRTPSRTTSRASSRRRTCSSRQELVARIFLDDYLPHLAARTPLAAAGGFAG